MPLSTPCPSCGSPITLGRLVASLTPWHVRCAGCRARLRLPRWPLSLVLATLAVAGGVAFGLARLLGRLQWPLVGVAASVVLLTLALDVVVCAVCLSLCSRAARINPLTTPTPSRRSDP